MQLAFKNMALYKTRGHQTKLTDEGIIQIEMKTFYWCGTAPWKPKTKMQIENMILEML